ncbi:MAG: hypothetical protein V1493_03255 [Candidatus Diapherotrites archaeon]
MELQPNKKSNHWVLIAIGIMLFFLLLVFILFPGTPFKPVNEPADTLEEAVSAMYYLAQSSHNVTFYKDYSVTRAWILTKADVGISEGQLCLSLGDFTGDADFEGTAQTITYKGGDSKIAKFSVLCLPGEEMLSEIGEGAVFEDIKTEWASGCECVTDPVLQEQVCCLIALRNPR